MSKKANVITLQNVRNYGSVLQALATQETLNKHGYEAWFYDYYKPSSPTSKIARAKIYCKNSGIFGRIIKTAMLYPTFARQDKIFLNFLNKYINTIPGIIYDEADIAKLPNHEADVYITGSDQTWNSGWNNGIALPLFLSFVPKDKKKIAYAASFGKDRLDDWEKEETRRLLSEYSAISVRESSAVDIIDDLNIGIKAVHVPDPTLQVSGDFWRQKLSRPVKDSGYCLLYQLNHNPEFDRFAIEFAHKKGLKLIRWCNRYDQARLPADKKLKVPAVDDFVSYIDHADFILTDSFHCTAFSTNLNKQFLSAYPAEYGGRIDSLLKLTGNESRRIAEFNNVDHYLRLPDIDFTEANNALDAQRKTADDFLDKALS